MTHPHPEAADLPETSVSRWNPYPETRDSGVDWLGAIPAHWSIGRLKFLCESIQTGPFGSQLHAEEYIQGGIPVINPSHVVNGQLVPDEVITVDQETWKRLERHHLRKGDVVFARRGEMGRCGLVSTAQEGWICSTGSLRVRLDTITAFPPFINIFLSLKDVKEWLELNSVGSTLDNLNTAIVGNIVLAVPPLPEQHAIAAFLDRETAELDALIAKKRELIATLHEQRSAIISHAVTKGLNPDVPMKDSGIEWIGDIPAHWESPKLKWVARLESGHTPSRQVPEYWVNCTIPWVSLADVGRFRDDHTEVIQDTGEMISELGLANSAARLLPTETVILSRTASVGFSVILGKPMATTQDFVNWICSEYLYPPYLLYCFRAMRSELARLTMGSTHQTIYMPDVARFAVPLPPLEEQTAIVEHIRSEKRHIDELIAKTEGTISHLQEYRAALISAAVTGKIDVRGE